MKIQDPSIDPETRLLRATERALDHLSRPHLRGRQLQHAKAWVEEAAHAVFQIHPELRANDSLVRYFIGKPARKCGIRGAALTAYIEEQFNNGTWWEVVPADVIASAHARERDSGC